MNPSFYLESCSISFLEIKTGTLEISIFLCNLKIPESNEKRGSIFRETQYKVERENSNRHVLYSNEVERENSHRIYSTV